MGTETIENTSGTQIKKYCSGRPQRRGRRGRRGRHEPILYHKRGTGISAKHRVFTREKTEPLWSLRFTVQFQISLRS